MIEALDGIIPGIPANGAAVLAQRLAALLDTDSISGRLIEHCRLADSVLRVSFLADGREHHFVIKRLKTREALLNELAVAHWLPVGGLDGCGPPLLDSCPADHQYVWHIYEDLGDCGLHEDAPDPDSVRAAIRLIATLHRRFASHPVLAECRLHGADLGTEFLRTSITDATRVLEALCTSARPMDSDQLTLCERILDRLQALAREQDARAALMNEQGGPETLLHGDLWPMNILVARAHDLHARLIDWDRAGVGPPAYDLSTLLSRFARRDRWWVLDLYREHMEGLWILPDASALNTLFQTAEYARLSQCVVWPALELLENNSAWAFDELRNVDAWFASMEPQLLDLDANAPPEASR